MTQIEIKLALVDQNKYAMVPTRGSEEAAGYDLFCVSAHLCLPGQVILIGTNLKADIPRGYEMQLRQRSGLSKKWPNYLANGVGTIDSDYMGEILVMFVNNTKYPINIDSGTRICQAIIKPVLDVSYQIYDKLTKITGRSDKGFGSTGEY
jgi:dUTP pyrophosphatase